MRGGQDPSSVYTEYISLDSKGVEENFAYYHRPRLVNFDTCSGPETAEPTQTEDFYGKTW